MPAHIQTHLTLLIDETASMTPYASQVVDGLNHQERRDRIERAIVEDAQRVAVEAVLAAWLPLVDAKQQAWQGFVDALTAVRRALAALQAVHGQQAALTARLPAPHRETLSFPDTGSFTMNLISRLPDSAGWQMVLLGANGFQPPNLQALMDVDAGSKALPPRLLQRINDSIGSPRHAAFEPDLT